MKKNILVAFGGISTEHEVSVITAIQAISALDENKYQILPFYASKEGSWFTGEALKDLKSYQDLKGIRNLGEQCHFEQNDLGQYCLSFGGGFLKKRTLWPIHAVLLAFHGSDGENGAFQGLFESMSIAYSGSGILASSVGMDKAAAKALCRSEKIPVVDDVIIYEHEWVNNTNGFISDIKKLGFPVFVKPARLGSSIGVQRVESEADLEDAIETCFRYDEKLIVEQAVYPLREINCSVLGNHKQAQASVCEQPKGSSEVLSFEDKYQGGSGTGKGMASAERLIPAPISEELTIKIQTLSIQIFKLLDASGVARLDFLVNSETDEVFFNEINTIPGSLSFYLWDKSDISFPDLLDRLIAVAEENHQVKNGRVRSYETNLLSTKAVTGIKGLKK